MYARELILGHIDLSRENDAFFSECLLCRACVDMCFSAVKTDEIVLAGRRASGRVRGMSPVYTYIFNDLLPDHQKLGRVVRLAASTRRIVPIQVIHALRIFGWTGLVRGTHRVAPSEPAETKLERADQFLREIPKTFLRERLAQRGLTGGTKQAAFFVGCGTNFMFPHVGEASIDVLEKLGYQVTVLENGCCGLPAFAHGALEAAQRLAIKNIAAFSDGRDSLIVTDCSSCASFLKDYPKLLLMGNPPDKAVLLEAEAFSARVRDITELLKDGDRPHFFHGETARPAKKMGAVPISLRRVTFHDPCHLSRHQKLQAVAREALRSLPSIDFIEMKEADWCCGGAGSFAVEHPDLSLKILDRKIQNIISSGADTIVTTCPACLMQIRSGLKQRGSTIRALHLAEITRNYLA